MTSHTSIKNSLVLLCRLSIALLIESLWSVFSPDVPEGEETECERGERAPNTADNGDGVVIDCNDDKSAGNGHDIWRVEHDLDDKGFYQFAHYNWFKHVENDKIKEIFNID